MKNLLLTITFIGTLLIQGIAVAQSSSPTPYPSPNDPFFNPTANPDQFQGYSPASMPDIYVACYNGCMSAGGSVTSCYNACFQDSSCDGIKSKISPYAADYEACQCMLRRHWSPKFSTFCQYINTNPYKK